MTDHFAIHHSPEDQEPVSKRAISRSHKQVVLVLVSGIFAAVLLELIGRGLYAKHGLPFQVTGLFTLGALFIWGSVSIYVILRFRSGLYVTSLVVVGAVCIVLSQLVSVAHAYEFSFILYIMTVYPAVYFVLEEGFFLIGLTALFVGFYASIFVTHRSILETEAKHRLLAHEVEERKHAQEALKQSEQTLRTLVSVNPESLLLVDAGRRVLVANEAAARRLGSTPGELAGNDMLEFYPLSARETALACFEKAAFNGTLCRFEEERRGRYYESYICPVKGEDGAIRRYAVMDVDITERRKMEEELRLLNRDLETGIRQRILELQRTNERLLDAINLNQELISVSPLGILVFTMTGNCLVVNRAALECFECEAEELHGESHCLVRLLERLGLQELALEVRSGTAPLSGEMHAAMPSGRERWLEYYASFFTSAGEKHLLVMVNDMSERIYTRVLMEEQRQKLENAARMTTIGLMAGGIAHEVKRPLSVLVMSADQLKSCCDRGELTPEQVNPILDIILRNVSLMEEIVRSLQNFLREGAQDSFETVPVKRILEDTITLCQHGFQRERIELRFSEIPEITVECRSCQLTQVLANLLNNARDAVRSLEEKWVCVDMLVRNESLVFAVTDSGAIPVPEIRQKLFQPLFTTKASDAGMGLGLSISKRLVENHKGRCYLDENHPNTRFVVEVPLKQAGG